MSCPSFPSIAARNAAIVAGRRAGRLSAELAAEYGISVGLVRTVVCAGGGAGGGANPTGRRRPARGPFIAEPSTGEPEYTAAETAFLAACLRYRVQKGRPFLTACDYLAVLISLGYRQPAATAAESPAT